MSVISFRLPKNIQGWKVRPISTTLLIYTNKDFQGEILVSRASSTELEIIYINAKEDVADSFYIPRLYDHLDKSLADILEKSFNEAKEKARKRIIDMIQM